MGFCGIRINSMNGTAWLKWLNIMRQSQVLFIPNTTDNKLLHANPKVRMAISSVCVAFHPITCGNCFVCGTGAISRIYSLYKIINARRTCA